MSFDKSEYQREYMRKKRGKEGLSPIELSPDSPRYEYDKDKYPNFKAWKIAVERALRAQSYARKFPELIKPGDAKYSTVEWQYEHEGLPSVHRPETHMVP